LITNMIIAHFVILWYWWFCRTRCEGHFYYFSSFSKNYLWRARWKQVHTFFPGKIKFEFGTF